MTSLIRPFLSSILCCVIAFGHAPVWLHVATCDGHSHAEVVEKSDDSAKSCSHCCHYLDVDTGVDQPSMIARGAGGSHQEHDSDNCLICHSRATPSGVAWQTFPPVFTGASSLPAPLPGECVFVSASRTIAHPRGPPIVA